MTFSSVQLRSNQINRSAPNLQFLTMTDSRSNFDGLSSLIGLSGLQLPARARFVAQFVGSTLFTSLTVGFVAGQTGAMLSCGPLIPFMTGSWLGYTWGCVGFWKQSKNKALTCARRYPKVMAHGLLMTCNMEVPTKLVELEEDGTKETSSGQTLEEWIIAGGISRLSYAILASQSCEEDISEMQRNERQKLIEGYSLQKD